MLSVNGVSPDTLADWLTDGDEIALLDPRGRGAYSERHLFHAANVALSVLETQLARLVPRRSTRTVWCDAGDGLAHRAAVRSIELGWTDVHVLSGGVDAWAAEGHEVYSGVNVPSKAFGELIEHAYDTPRISASELSSLLESDADVVVLDSRPLAEFERMSIPTGIDCPGAELVHRVKEVAPDPDTTVVVNCAGRTRSIIGCQSLRNAGMTNVVALENGTMGWQLAGLTVDHGNLVHAPPPRSEAASWAQAAAADVGQRFGVRTIDAESLGEWLSDDEHTTYLFDVRTPAEFETGHVAGCSSAPGGQLVQATDEYAATRNARIVLVDDDGTRAMMTASWLRQLGWADAVVLDANPGDVVGPAVDDGPLPPTSETISVEELRDLLDQDSDEIAIVDVGSSNRYRRKHVEGAMWCPRAHVVEAMTPGKSDFSEVIVVCDDDLLAQWATADLATAHPQIRARRLEGGTTVWAAQGLPTESGMTAPLTAVDDVWMGPYSDDERTPEQRMNDYLTWEIGLVDQIERDSTVSFPPMPV